MASFFDKLNVNPRERRLVGVIGVVLGVVLLVLAPIGMELLTRSRRADNEELRTALAELQDARGKLRDRQAKKDAVLARYGKRAPALAGFLEQSARAQKLEVTDSVDRPDLPLGKRYIERSTVVHLKKAGMLAIAKFLEGLEKSGNAVAVTRLNLRKRPGEPDAYDVEVGVSAYDRVEPKPSTATDDKDKKP
jgi:general secretion pathway protein M